MSTIARAQIGFYMDSALPRDVMTINPQYVTDDPQVLADKLKANIIGSITGGALNWFTVKLYDLERPVPSYPIAVASNVVAQQTTSHPREVGLCLSYYCTNNRPGSRGRLYIPGWMIPGSQGLRPTTTQMQAALDIGNNVLKITQPAGTYWALWSKEKKQVQRVTNTWVDDEWDITRSRGLKGTTRVVATVFP